MFHQIFSYQLTIGNAGYGGLLYNGSIMHHAPNVSLSGCSRPLGGQKIFDITSKDQSNLVIV